MSATKTRVLTAHIPQPLANKVDDYAARLERPRGWVVKQALLAWVESQEECDRLTRESLADVDAGRLIDNEDVTAWADSLSGKKPLDPPA